jgi:hypothetical protein
MRILLWFKDFWIQFLMNFKWLHDYKTLLLQKEAHIRIKLNSLPRLSFQLNFI